MLIDFSEAVKKYGMKITGAIQVGAHEGQEIEVFEREGIQKVVLFEPCKRPVKILLEKTADKPLMRVLPFALGNMNGNRTMYTEMVNNGQSNSFLKPKKHLEQHPSIIFDGKEEVVMMKLDDYFIYFGGCNLLVMDCQGTELDVLNGGLKTLRNIDYVYTEVNREEIYEGCTRVEEIDQLLLEQGFEDLEQKWVGGWGDKLYQRRDMI